MDTLALERLVTDIALNELGEDENTREEGLRKMRTWIHQHPNILHCRTDDNFLLRFLRVKKYDVTKAQQMLFNFLKLKEALPHSLLSNHDVTSPSVNEFMCDGFYFASPRRDVKGRKVIMVVLNRLDLSKKYSFAQPARTIVLTNITAMEEEASQVLGYVYVFDAAKMSLRHLSMWPSPFEVMRFLKSGEAAIPMRNKEVHLLNVPPYLTWCLNLLKTAITKKLSNRFVIHNSLKTLHQMVDPKVLPKEYGGVISMDEMIESWRQELVRKRDKIKEFDNIKLRKDEKRSQLENSFRNLQVD